MSSAPLLLPDDILGPSSRRKYCPPQRIGVPEWKLPVPYLTLPILYLKSNVWLTDL